MPSALVLDDSPARLRSFRRGLVGLAHTVLFDRAAEAIDHLRENAPTVVFLDHDLTDYGRDVDDAGTGMDVVSYLCAHADRLAANTRVVIHSLNPLAAPMMAKCLHGCGYRCLRTPFIWEHPELLATAVDGSLFPPPKKTVS
jgi:CheY-like chemotaxis protein